MEQVTGNIFAMSQTELPFSSASERNKEPILAILRDAFAQVRTVLEIGSGTGQHAVHFARNLPQLAWQPSDRGEYLPGLRARVLAEGPVNLRAPIELDVTSQRAWLDEQFDALYTANTFHIMSWPEVQAFFGGLALVLGKPATLAVYGPFNMGGGYTSQSNAAFDAQLRQRDPASGLRDLEEVDALAVRQGLVMQANHAMPANNRLVLWRA
jgi:cyclopropane fatty-acyl-phospholipid synthase-like methyltransferase